MTTLKRNHNCFKFLCVIFILLSSSAGNTALGGRGAKGAYKTLARKLAQGAKSLENKKIAILPFHHHDGTKSAGSVIVSERLTTYLGEYDTLSVIERTLLDKVMKEHKLAQTGLIDQKTTKQIGKILGVEAIITGTLIDLENKKTEVNARMIHTETGKILSTGFITIKRTWAYEEEKRAAQQQLSNQQTYRQSPPPRSTVADDRFEFILKLGYDTSGKVVEDGTYYYRNYYGSLIAVDYVDTLDADNAVSLTAEMIGYFNDYLGLGGGLTYQTSRGAKNIDGKFQYTPVYGLCKIRFTNNTVSPYLIGQGGYNFVAADTDYTWNGDIEGGAYLGIGGGLQFFNGLLFELLYSQNYAYLEISGSTSYEIYLTYKKVRLAVGYVF